MYKPKDIVAGDFYWFESSGDYCFFAAADCTGHGVPGAMVSLVCHNALNRSVKEFGLLKPHEILDKTREIVIAEFEKSDEDVKDGMDISLCALNTKTNNLFWAGAHNPLWILRNGTSSTSVQNELAEGVNELVEFKPDKQPIGKFMDAKPFTNQNFQLQKGDCVYLFSDGFKDQFGGENQKSGGKKFKASKLKELILSINSKAMNEQKELLDAAFISWKGELDQVDDVCILGVRI